MNFEQMPSPEEMAKLKKEKQEEAKREAEALRAISKRAEEIPGREKEVKVESAEAETGGQAGAKIPEGAEYKIGEKGEKGLEPTAEQQYVIDGYLKIAPEVPAVYMKKELSPEDVQKFKEEENERKKRHREISNTPEAIEAIRQLKEDSKRLREENARRMSPEDAEKYLQGWQKWEEEQKRGIVSAAKDSMQVSATPENAGGILDKKPPKEVFGGELKKEEISQREIPPTFQEPEVVEQIEKKNLQEVITKYLAYQDAPLSEELKKQILETSFGLSNAAKYGEILRDAFSEYGPEKMDGVTEELLKESESVLDSMGLESTPFGKSKTWAYWDIAKQLYYLARKEEADPNYILANPLVEKTKLEEILNRHTGWEIYGAYKTHPAHEFLDRLKKDKESYSKIINLLEKSPKENGTLSSKDLAELGFLIRENLAS